MPVQAFVTFHSAEARDRFLHYYAKKDKNGNSNPKYKPLEDLGHKLEVKEAPEPSDIIWEHIEFSYAQRWSYFFLIYVLVCVGIVAVSVLQISLKSIPGEVFLKYPERVKCAPFNSQFGTFNREKNDFTFDENQKKSFKHFANLDKKLTNEGAGAGYYLCFCRNNVLGTDEICAKYNDSLSRSKNYKLAFLGLFIVINILIKNIVPMLVNLMRYDSLSKKNNMIMIFTLILQAFNSFIVPLVAAGDFRWYRFLNILRINGQYADFN